MAGRRRRSDRQPPTKEHVKGLVEDIRSRLYSDRCPDVAAMPDAPAALMEWVIAHHATAGHNHSYEHAEDNVRDAMVIHAYVGTWFLCDMYDTGQALGMNYEDFSDRSGPEGSGYWTRGRQVHQARHRAAEEKIRRKRASHSVVTAARAAASTVVDANELVAAAMSFLRARNGFGASLDSDFLALTCEDLEGEAAPPPGIPVDVPALRVSALCAVQDIRDLQVARVLAGEKPGLIEDTYTPAAKAALEQLKRALGGD